MSKQHWKAGLWTFDTCNANAWPGAKKYLEKTQADFVAVRESKLPKTECNDAEQTARNFGWRTPIGPCTVTAADGKSAGVAISGRTRIGMESSISPEAWPKMRDVRFIVKHAAANCKGGIHANSCYLTSCNVGPKTQGIYNRRLVC